MIRKMGVKGYAELREIVDQKMLPQPSSTAFRSKLDVRSRSAVEQTNALENQAQSKNEIFSFGKLKR